MELSENTKKICLFSIIGIVLVCSGLAALLPEFRTTAVDIVKSILGTVQLFTGK
jgi:hypothetical protein